MNIEEYRQTITPLNKEINYQTSQMANQVYKLAKENNDDLKQLIVDPDFNFYNINGKFLSTETMSVELFSYGNEKIYFDTSREKIVYYQYDSSIQMKLPQPVSKELLCSMFEDIDCYKNAVHVLGLSGVLELSVKERSDILKSITSED
ncbi:hypothetical protein LZY01_16370 [Levilactobacillus zymae]|uniref:Uncharacterized protein n=1 Tax=Levilactobacillus zymae TaxID=267363 RepID=A0ABQ0WX64_9LACO|nr:hypothetical protein [Levilactobacillus zymae]QFR61838.1 hypothetical protein LZ395_10000 [Levilactobacillus zymae]GEO72469.1 hypothetical protein LZY01_16370 [Levilactobacillus zymae]